MANKQRLIDANEAYEIARGSGRHNDFARSRADLTSLEEVLEECTTVDAVEVVRCKECKSWEQYNACDGTKPHRCMNHDAIFYKLTAPDDFCSYGERRTDV